MEERGLVTSEVADPIEGRVGRPRKYYTIEPAGARALHQSFSTLQAIAGGALDKLQRLAEG